MDDEAAVDLLIRAVETPSVSGEEQAVAELLVERMRRAGFDRAEVDEAGNAVGHIGDGARRLVLLGHMDTVPGEVPVRREGRLLYGRGSVDAKGPLAAFVAAASRAGARAGWTVTVVGAVEEEAPTSKGARHVAPLWRPEACVIGEPSGSRAVTLGYKGRLLVDYRHAQGTGHSAGPGESAPTVGVAFWNALVAAGEELNAGRERIFDQLTPSLLSIRSGSDGLEEWVELTVSWRTPLWFRREEWEARIRELAGSAELRFYGGEVAVKGGKQNPLVRSFLASIRAEGARPRFKVKTGTSDMNVVGPVWGCPILAYGPGDSSLDHTPTEHIDLDEYLEAVRVLTGVIERLCA
ncbi:MAG: [LysW]-lysine hydrolase [Planctomycetota bacterium]|nr:MAG: [LysW]-lysine hydrolase [Planctomycetota bacterium]